MVPYHAHGYNPGMRQKTALSVLRDSHFLRLATIVGCAGSIHPFLAGAVLIYAIVRWINLRDDPRFAKLPDDPP